MFPYNYQYQTNYQPYAQFIGHNLSGRYVNTFDEITANDVPMDGGYSTFIKNDMSEIQLRKWNPNGSIDRTTYKPISEPFVQPTVNSQSENVKAVENDLTSKLDGIMKQLFELSAKVENFCTPPTPKNNSQKGGDK